MSPEDVRKMLERQEEILRRLDEVPRRPDPWSRIPVLTGFVSMLLVFYVGYTANRLTDAYKESEKLAREEMNRHTTKTQNLQVLAQFVPLLTSDDPARQRIAVRGMYHMGGADLLRMALLGVKELPKPVACESLALTRERGIPEADRQIILQTHEDVLRLRPVTPEELLAC